MEKLTTIFKALSDGTRLRIVKLLEQGELCVRDIVAALDMMQPKVSFHLSALKGSGLIKDRKKGKWIHYSLNESDLFKRMLMVQVCERVEGALISEDKNRLARFLKSKNPVPPRRKARLAPVAHVSSQS